MDFSKITHEWNRTSFALDNASPPELRVDMFVRKSGGNAYDIGWAAQFTGNDTVNFKSLADISKETGVDFSAMGIDGDLSQTHSIKNVPAREVILWHTVSRFWAIKNGLIDNLKSMHVQNAEAAAHNQTEAEMQARIQKLQKMTYQVLKQNAVINKRLKHRQQQIKAEQKPKSFWKRLFG